MSMPATSIEAKVARPVRPGYATRSLFVITALVAGDLAGLLMASLAAFWLRVHFIGPLDAQLYWLLLPTLLFYPLAYAYSGLYPGYGIPEVDQFRRLFHATFLVSLGMVSLTFVFQRGTEYSRAVIITATCLAITLTPLTRAICRSLLSRTSWWGKPVLILGAGHTERLVVKQLVRHPGIGLRPAAILDDDTTTHGQQCAGVGVIGPLHLGEKIARSHRIDTAVVALPGVERRQLFELLETHAAGFRHVLLIPNLFGLNSTWVTPRDLRGILGLDLRQNLLYPHNRWLKRVLDLSLGLPLFLIAVPIIGLAMLAVKALSPGPAFFSQEREGYRGRRIRVWKIRTMVPDAEAALQRYLAADAEARAEWEQHMKLRHDPRVVPGVGHLLRRFSLDELPQLWNVLTGDMSLVGPRPFPDYHLERFSSGFKALRRRVPPGITGLWQVSDRSEADLERQEELDTYYIRNWSPWLDLYLLVRTVAAVLGGRGAY